MSDELLQFRRRAADCRDLAERARDRRDAEMLAEIADELDAEADKIEAEEATRPHED